MNSNHLNTLIVILAAISYVPYHWLYFSYVEGLLKMPRLSRKKYVFSFLFNYIVFYILSISGTYLAVNWLIIAVVFVFEIKILFQSPIRYGVFCGLQGSLVGLSLNFTFRALTAVVMDLPLSAYDSIYHIETKITNYKQIPIIIAFWLSGFVFVILKRQIKEMDLFGEHENKRNIFFGNCLLAAIFVYLLTNLLIYNISANDLHLKIWQMKTGVCALIALSIGFVYMKELSLLDVFESKLKYVREELQINIQDEKDLQEIADVDVLTGVYTRSYGLKILNNLLQQKIKFFLGFIDLDKLKPVNDSLGHDAGDRYLSEVTHSLKNAFWGADDTVCRFGGDEFVVLTKDVDELTFTRRMKEARCSLEERSNTSECPFAMSFSYGIVLSGEQQSVEQLLEEADQKMYEDKRARKK